MYHFSALPGETLQAFWFSLPAAIAKLTPWGGGGGGGGRDKRRGGKAWGCINAVQCSRITLSTAASTAAFMAVDFPPPRDMLKEGIESSGRGDGVRSLIRLYSLCDGLLATAVLVSDPVHACHHPSVEANVMQ